MAKFNLRQLLLLINLSLTLCSDQLVHTSRYVFSTSLPADPSLSSHHYRGLITALVNLNPVIDSHSIALINTNLTFETLRPMIVSLSRIQVYPQFLPLHGFYFDFLQSFPRKNHLHFTSNVFFTINMIKLLNSEEIFACTRLDNPFRQDFFQFLESSKIEINFFNTHRVGFISSLLTDSLWCSLDVFSLSGSIVSSFFLRLKGLDDSFRLYSNTLIDPKDRTYYHILLLNLALWESFIIPKIIRTEADPLSEVILFPSSKSILYERVMRGNDLFCVITPVGFENHSLVSDLIISSHSSHLCSLLGQFETIKPIGTFVEIGNYRLLSRSRPGDSGMTILTQEIKSINAEQFKHMEFLSYKSHEVLLHAYGTSPSEISFPMIYSTVSQQFQRILYYKLHGCYSHDLTFYVMHDPISSVNLSCQRPIPSESGHIEDNLMIGFQFYQLFHKLPPSTLPCLISIHPGLILPAQEQNFNEFMAKLGLIPMNIVTSTNNTSITVALGAHCRSNTFDLLAPLIEEKEILEKLRIEVDNSVGLMTPHQHQTSSRTFCSVNRSVGALGTRLIRNIPQNPELLNKGITKESNIYQLNQNNPIGVIENILPVPLLNLLTGRLRHKINVNLGANSHFIPFNSTLNSLSMPRSLVEHVILEYIAPLVVGTQEEALKNGFIGAEWWIHSRSSDDPKEYHMDTAITWCRDNGWSSDLLSACHFYPAIGTVNYLTDEGGPTVVFDQISSDNGLFPTLPQRVGIGFPRRNRMLLFKGNRYHGVMKHPTVNVSENRLTLLVNYWKEKPAGETFTHVLEQEHMYLERGYELTRQSSVQDTENFNGYREQKNMLKQANKLFPTSYLPFHVVAEDHDFQEDLFEWKQQLIPPFYSKYISLIQRQEFSQSIIPSKCLFTAFPLNLIQEINVNTSLLEELEDRLCMEQTKDISDIQSAPVIIFHLSNSSINEMVKKHYSEYTLHNWPLWNVDKGSNNIQMVVASLVEESRNWKRNMPGGWNSSDSLN